MVDYSEMSDAELNIEVAKIQYPNDQCVTPYTHRPDAYIYHRNNLHTSKDYCNNPADAWPIIIENRISVYPQAYYEGSKWLSSLIDSQIEDEVADENPLRAAMIVFLMMQDAKNG